MDEMGVEEVDQIKKDPELTTFVKKLGCSITQYLNGAKAINGPKSNLYPLIRGTIAGYRRNRYSVKEAKELAWISRRFLISTLLEKWAPVLERFIQARKAYGEETDDGEDDEDEEDDDDESEDSEATMEPVYFQNHRLSE
jgi:hypothetical protein